MDSAHCHCPTQVVSGAAYGGLCNKVVGGLSLSLWETVGIISDYCLSIFFQESAVMKFLNLKVSSWKNI